MYMNRLLHSVIWPAVAGNILWAFLQVAVAPDLADPSFFPKLAALLFVGIYLAIDWVDTEKMPEINDHYWKFDLPLSVALATFAIGTQSNNWWSNIALATAFVVVAVGHYNGAWDLKQKPSSGGARVVLALFNIIGVVLLIIGAFSPPPYSFWLTPAAIFVVVALFLALRKKVSSAWKSN